MSFVDLLEQKMPCMESCELPQHHLSAASLFSFPLISPRSDCLDQVVRLIASISRLVPCQRGSLTSCYLVILSSLPTHYHLAAYMRNCANTHYRALSVVTELPSGSPVIQPKQLSFQIFFCLLFDPRLAPCKTSYCLQPARSQSCHENT